MHVTNECKVGVFLYDVACRFQSFFRAWLMSLKVEECYGFSIAKRQQILDFLLNVLPPMHVNGKTLTLNVLYHKENHVTY